MNTREAISVLAIHHLTANELLTLAAQVYVRGGGNTEPTVSNPFTTAAEQALMASARA